MKIRTVEYAGTLAQPDGPLPGDLPQVAFSGRSNVGKSSLINLLLRRHRSKIAHVSGQPGKTQAVNFYRVNDAFFLVDLPGFGYAKVPKAMRDGWKHLVEGYLAREQELRGVVHLVDCRRPPTELDLEMLDYLAVLGLPTLVVLTKIDKLKRSQRVAAVNTATRQLGIDAEQLVPVSSKTGEGRDVLLGAVAALLAHEPGAGSSEEGEESSQAGDGPDPAEGGAASPDGGTPTGDGVEPDAPAGGEVDGRGAAAPSPEGEDASSEGGPRHGPEGGEDR